MGIYAQAPGPKYATESCTEDKFTSRVCKISLDSSRRYVRHTTVSIALIKQAVVVVVAMDATR